MSSARTRRPCCPCSSEQPSIHSPLAADPKFLGGQIGALAVLHTWTRTLEWHPHLHVLVPGGALAADMRTWLPVAAPNKRFLVPVKALAQRFRGRFLHLARRSLPSGQLPHVPWAKPWVVYAKPAVQGADAVLAYLGRYVHRTAIADKAVVASPDGRVTFTYRDSRDQTRKRMTLPAHEFLRRFLQHVPAKGVHRVRAYGLLHPAHRDTLRRLQLPLKAERAQPIERNAVRRARRCPRCHQDGLVLLRRLTPDDCVAWSARHLLAAAHARAPPTITTLTHASTHLRVRGLRSRVTKDQTYSVARKNTAQAREACSPKLPNSTHTIRFTARRRPEPATFDSLCV